MKRRLIASLYTARTLREAVLNRAKARREGLKNRASGSTLE